MSRDILANIIEDFNPDKFILFFRNKNRTFAPRKEELSQYNDESFKNGIKLGEINFAAEEQMIICIFVVNQPLSERSGKKAQYEKGKIILREQQVDSGIFIFCDKKGNFRFSLIYANYLGKRRDWSTFRRFTYFVSREFTNKTFLQRIGDGEFSTIENIKEAFSVEPVNKEFYARIAMLFTKLAGGERRIGKDEFKGKGLLHLPSTTDDTLNKEFTIRLIGRLVFCWFLKKKHSESGLPLLSNELLSMAALMKNENYYHTILEPLFFETLNTPAEERKKKFQLGPWADVPFLNGGLFSPDEHDFYEVNELGISEFINVLKVPDKWVKDILEVFETYNFTIDENTFVDVELAIDPEILGRIFENLLAEINPETGETARKSTGSYYTPRPIVEYMVDESLKQYILTKVKISEDKVSSLLSYSNEGISLSESEKDSVLGALDVIKIIDPACGSGAFPMGILHKMLLILQKIDPDSQKWIERKLSQVENITVRKELGKKLREENWNYVHKLGIIQSSIYGVDIQPVATEISRLRFFLSLVVDDRVEDNKPNRGIDPLPNLEFKFVCANSLIPLAEEGGELFDNKEMAQQMQDIRDRYFKTDNARIKIKMKKDFENVLKKGCSLFASKKQKQLLTYHPFDTNNICCFFDSKFMFGIDRFDVVIGNPPYIFSRENLTARDKGIYKESYTLTQFKINLYILFIEKAFNMLNDSGTLAFIIPNNWLTLATNSDLRYFLLTKCFGIKIVLNYDKVFENANVDTCILIFEKKGLPRINSYQWNADGIKLIKNQTSNFYLSKNNYILGDLALQSDGSFEICEKINAMSKILSGFAEVKNGVQAYTVGEGEPKQTEEMKEGRVYHSRAQRDKTWIKYLDGIDVMRYRIGWSGEFIKYGQNLSRRREPFLFQGERLLVRQIPGKPPYCIHCCYTNEHTINDNNSMIIKITNPKINLKYLLGLLNSKLISFWFMQAFGKLQRKIFPQFKVKELRIFPVKEIAYEKQEPIINLVDKIVSLASTSDYLTNHTKQSEAKEYERQIDQMVYKLYGLTPVEIEIVEESKV